MLRHDWRRRGISAEEVREFCVWRNAPMRVLSSQGDLVDSYDPALKEHRTVCFLAFDGHCYMYKAVKRVLERQAEFKANRMSSGFQLFNHPEIHVPCEAGSCLQINMCHVHLWQFAWCAQSCPGDSVLELHSLIHARVVRLCRCLKVHIIIAEVCSRC